MTLTDGQYALDGYTFGRGRPAGVKRIDRGTNTVRHQDTPVPGGTGRLMGRDYEDGAEWGIEFVIRANGEAEARAELGRLAAAWRRPYRLGELSALRWAIGTTARRVYGRARNLRDFAHPHLLEAGMAPALATFQLADPLIYDDEAHVLDLSLTSTSQGTLTLPATLPWVLGGRAGQRQGEVVVAGDAPVPFTLTFHGPSAGTASGFWARGPGWEVRLEAELAWDQSVTVDTRTSTVTRSDGLSLAGAARGRFLTARLQPGPQEVSWGAIDPTGTARMTLTHRPGYYSL